jgi:hypothetical protein
VLAFIESHCPDELGLPSPLWIRESVGTLIKKRFGLALSVWTVGQRCAKHHREEIRLIYLLP